MSNEPVQLDWLAAHPPAPAPAVPALQIGGPLTDSGPVFLTRVDPSCNMRRFYSVALTTSLFEEVGMVRHWGRIGTSGQTRTDWYEGSGSAEVACQKLVAQKRRRGYVSMP